MASESTFDYEELTDFGKQLLDTVEEMPKVAERFMKNEARTLSRRMKSRAKSELKAKTGNYLEHFKYGKKVYKWSDAEFNIRDYNDARHAHLIENGHRMVSHDGTDTGKYAPGKHIIENTAIAFENEFRNHVEDKLASQILKELSK